MPYKNVPDDKQDAMHSCTQQVEAKGKDKESAIRICYRSVVEGAEIDKAMSDFELDPSLFKPIEELAWVEPEPEAVMSTGFLFADLASLTDGRAFDGLAAGAFVDAHGTDVSIHPEDLPLIVENTKKAIEATKTESGEIVGLPIDETSHNRGPAAGWIVGIELAGEVVRLIPKWTELGISLISKGIQRYFSATLDIANKVFYGGTLTNWPATRNKKGKVLLRPIELSQTLCRIDTGGNPPPKSTKGETTMTVKLDELSQEDRAALVAEVAAAIKPELPKAEPVPAVEMSLSKLFEMEGLSEEAKTQRKNELKAEFAAIRKQAELEYRAEMVRLKHEGDMTELAQKLTGGTDEAPRGYRVAAEELKAHLLKLDADEAVFFGELLAKTAKDGFVEFGAKGHEKELKGGRELPAEIAERLDKGDFTVADLASPILGLGELSEYNLTKWQK